MLSFAHHPLCWHYRSHLITVWGIKLCLGCSGFYLGFIIGFFLLNLNKLTEIQWESFVILAFILYIPTILRLFNIPGFSTSLRFFRFLFRFLLGFGIAIGLISIFIAPNILLAAFQFIFGILLFIGIGIGRYLSFPMKECGECSFIASKSCPGLEPFQL